MLKKKHIHFKYIFNSHIYFIFPIIIFYNFFILAVNYKTFLNV